MLFEWKRRSIYYTIRTHIGTRDLIRRISVPPQNETSRILQTILKYATYVFFE